MGCLKLNSNKSLGKIIKMSKDKKKDYNKKKDNENKKVIQISLGTSIGIVVTIVIAIVSAAWLLATMFGEISVNIMSLSKDIININTELNNAKTERTEMHDYLYNDNGVQDQLGDIASDINEIKNLLNITAIIASPDLTSIIDTISIEPNDKNVSYASLLSTTYIGTDVAGNTYVAKDLVDEKILLTYTEDNKEVYFLGQYNEYYHWDGYCVTNSYYLDDTLYGICESNFDDGKRLDYKSFCVSESNANEWIYSDKICNENNNSGINVLCFLDYNKEKNFTNTNVRITDIIYVDDFVKNTKPTVRTYYSGCTYDGKYNDDTGNAYEVIYNEDGTVKTLYVGRFKDGTFNDNTGNAWDIAYSSEGGYYVYNTGKFKNGHAVNKSTNPINVDDINDIISERGQQIDIELKWKQN